MLEPCLRSTAPYVDEIIIAEGLIEGVPDLGLGLHSDLAWLAEPSDFLPDRIHIASRAGRSGEGVTPWPTLSSACTYILNKARELDCDWLLYVDADQELHNGQQLRSWLNYGGPVYPIRRVEPDGTQRRCPWQMIRVADFRRYLAGCYVLEDSEGRTLDLVPPDQGAFGNEVFSSEFEPWISHHPERRPPWRRGQRLGAFETILEPPPVDRIRADVLASRA